MPKRSEKMKKATAKRFLVFGVISVLALLLSPFYMRPKGFDSYNESLSKRYLRGVSYMTGAIGFNSLSADIRQKVESTPSSRVILQFDVESTAEASAISEAVWMGYGHKSSFLSTKNDLKNGKLRVEIDRGSEAWFEKEALKAKALFKSTP